MADQQPKVVTRVFNLMGAGVAPTAPPNSIDPESDSGYAWRDSLNLIERDGALVPRPGIVSHATETSVAALPYVFSATLEDGEAVISVYSFSTSLLVVTNRQVFKYAGGTWYNVTPTYTTGTVTATNGSPNVTGAGGTQWSTRVINTDEHILIEGEWYRISSVTSDTALILTENFRGATGGGKAYTIRRNWTGTAVPGDNVRDLIVSTVYNGSLYVAGPVAGGISQRAAVIKITEIGQGTSTVGTYITGKDEFSTGLDFIANLYQVNGITALQDGRIVIAGSLLGLDRSVVFYSSHLNDAVWTVSPGGQTTLTDAHDEDITAVGSLGSATTFHHQNGIILGHPTGQADPPLAYQTSAAHVGCWAPRTLVRYGTGVELFVAHDGMPYLFTGAEAKPLSEDLGFFIRQLGLTRERLRTRLHSGLDAARGLYLVFAWGATSNTSFWLCDIGNGITWACVAPLPISSCSSWLSNGTTHTGGVLTAAHRAYVGTSSLDGASEVAVLKLLKEGAADLAYASGAPQVSNVESDDLDFGNPLAWKQIEKIIAWFRPLTASGGPDTPILSVSIDGGVTWTDVTLSITLSSNLDKQIAVQASNFLGLAASHLIRVKLSWAAGDQPLTTCTRMVVVAHMGGSIEQTALGTSGS